MVLSDIIGSTLLDGTTAVSASEAVTTAKFVGLYFSAHWCPPCRMFTPVLSKCYNDRLKEAGVEIIFVSADNDEASFKEYYSAMPWKAVPFSRQKDVLSKRYKVRSIPALVLLHPNGSVAATGGIQLVRADPTGAALLSHLESSPPGPDPSTDSPSEKGDSFCSIM
eukprot:EG_transcript_27875